MRRAAVRVLGRDRIWALRHLAATALINGGSGVQGVDEYLGRADPATTLRFYVHEAVGYKVLGALEGMSVGVFSLLFAIS
jgi:integrase